jgi:hypothetical protein
MADNDYNMIKPVKGLQTITGLTPAKRREGRKYRQRLHQEKNKSTEEKETLPEEQTDNGQDDSGIDYCA